MFFLYGCSTKEELFEHLRSEPAFAFDMESVDDLLIGLGAGTDRIAGYGAGKRSTAELIDAIKDCHPESIKVAHAAKADLGMLGGISDRMWYPLFDTMVAASLLPSSSKFNPPGSYLGYEEMGLKYLTMVALGEHIDDYSDMLKRYSAKNLLEIPVDRVANYNLRQVMATYGLYCKFSAEIKSRSEDDEHPDYWPELAQVFAIEMRVLPIIAKMEAAGILVDAKRLEELGVQFRDEADALQIAVTTMTEDHIKNVNSPKQVREYLFGKEPGQLGFRPRYFTKGGDHTPQVSERTFSNLLDRHGDDPRLKWVPTLLRSRQIGKLVGTYCEGIVRTLDPAGRSHTTLSQVTAETGRLASKEPNHQNIPKRRPEGLAIRRGFISPPGHVLLAADMDQLELRILAEEAQEPKMIQAFLAGEDIHMRTAMEMFNDASKRFPAKILNYTIVYLAGAQQIGDQIHESKAKAQLKQDKYFRVFPRLKAWMKEWDGRCTELGYTETWLGRRRDVSRFYKEDNSGRWPTELTRKAVNTRIQGTAAEVLKLAMIRLDAQLRLGRHRSRMLMQIHDELLLEVPEDEIVEVIDLVREAMTTSYGDMPLPCTVKIGRNWADVDFPKLGMIGMS